MPLFHIPESVSGKNSYQGHPHKKNFMRVNKQLFSPLQSADELEKALAEKKKIISLSAFGFQRLQELNVITDVENAEEEEQEQAVHYKCNFHILSPIYSAINKFLGTGMILLGVSTPILIAVPVAFVGAACNFWVQYNFVTKSATGPKSLDYQASDVDETPPITWRDEVMAAATVVSSITEGAGSAAGVFLITAANNFPLQATIVSSLVAFKFKQGTTMQADGQKIFIEQGKNFAATTVGKIANLTQQFPYKYPFLIDFNSWIRDLLPTLESLLTALSFKAFLEERMDNKIICAALSAIVSSGEWYQQRGYSVNLIKHIQQLSDTRAPLGLAHLIDIIIRFYNESIGNIVNGRLVNDAIGIVIPPALWYLIIKITGNFFTGFVSGHEIIKLLPQLTEKLGIELPTLPDETEIVAKLLIGSICAVAAVSQYQAGYDKNLHGLPIGIKPLLEKVYQGSSVTEFSTQAITDRLHGFMHHMATWPQRFFKVGHDFAAECRSDYTCQPSALDDDLENPNDGTDELRQRLL